MADLVTPVEDDIEESASVGRPLAFKSVAELDQSISAYFADCDPHLEDQMIQVGTSLKGQATWGLREVMTEQKPYLMSGLAYHLNVDRKTLLNYSRKTEYFPSIQQAKARCEAFTEGQLYTSASGGARFSLTNNFDDWVERSSIDHTTKDQPIALVEFIGGAKAPDGKDPVS